MQERLQKLIARSGVTSRRKAEELITQGKVSVNGQIVTELGTKADPAVDAIVVKGRPLPETRTVVYLLNKPLDVIATTYDPTGRTHVTQLVPNNPPVYPVGRLDRMTEGLLLLTNDGDLALRLTHPRYEHPKEYEVTGTTKLPVRELISRLGTGAMLDDGPIVPDRVELGGIRDNRVVVRITIHEGRNHLIRRLSSAVGLEITRLVRIRIGSLTLGNLPVGRYRVLTEAELSDLRALLPDQSNSLPPDPASGSSDQLRSPSPGTGPKSARPKKSATNRD